MKFLDQAKIYLRSGSGGDGVEFGSLTNLIHQFIHPFFNQNRLNHLESNAKRDALSGQVVIQVIGFNHSLMTWPHVFSVPLPLPPMLTQFHPRSPNMTQG